MMASGHDGIMACLRLMGVRNRRDARLDAQAFRRIGWP
jgi:hypothetical protein